MLLVAGAAFITGDEQHQHRDGRAGDQRHRLPSTADKEARVVEARRTAFFRACSFVALAVRQGLSLPQN
jgi:hypothetical protein